VGSTEKYSSFLTIFITCIRSLIYPSKLSVEITFFTQSHVTAYPGSKQIYTNICILVSCPEADKSQLFGRLFMPWGREEEERRDIIQQGGEGKKERIFHNEE